MSCPRLPQEIYDYIVDVLRDEPKTLKNCGLVCKSWVPSVQKHIFGRVALFSISDLRAWKKTFPDAVDSPALYTRTLYIIAKRFCPP
ncbi:hypothetical protein BJ322DRAFT_529404 [Thelephora terrestris]|uniref:F-box domain-containing protein n=1 Tax=Thelephora terrestris TaxID=56493 RepID=A0A9P6L9X1_9AGAM|nr:hypothetical protein BJ322DRAFT_529404 [Thelephora terrestris]